MSATAPSLPERCRHYGFGGEGWSRSNQILILSPAIALSPLGLEVAWDLYSKQSNGIGPTTLLMEPHQCGEAYRLMPELHFQLLVVPIPGFPVDGWAVTGSEGIIWSLP